MLAMLGTRVGARTGARTEAPAGAAAGAGTGTGPEARTGARTAAGAGIRRSVRRQLTRRLAPLAARALRPVAGLRGLAALGTMTLVCVGTFACNEIDVSGRAAGLSPAEAKLASRDQWPATLEGEIELDVSEPAPGDDLYIYATLFTDRGEVLVFAMDSQLRRWGVLPGDRIRAKVRPSDSDLVGDERFYDLVDVQKLTARAGSG
ncbi:MAG: hypothetical protein ACQGVK_18020 [Myxococcota bacterium]